MRGFRVGSYQRDLAPRHLRHFCPAEALDRIEDIDLEGLWAAGKRVILLDVDNTLLPWRSREIPKTTHEWLAKAKAIGFRFCVLSNTRHPERLVALTKEMEIDYVRDKFKPSTRMYEIALERLEVKPEEAVMVGDQLLTDILGANRAGIDAIWIRPMGKREFVGTRYFSRNVERIVGRFLHDYFQPTDVVETGGPPDNPGFFDHSIIREFVKFAIVGGTSTLIDLGLHYTLMHKVVLGGHPIVDTVGRWALGMTQPGGAITAEAIQKAAFGPLKVVPVLLAILNGYYWNSLWTFRMTSAEGRGLRILKFYVVALLAGLVNLTIGSTVYSVTAGSDTVKWAVASAAGMSIGVFVNFFGQRMWTFKRDQSDKSDKSDVSERSDQQP